MDFVFNKQIEFILNCKSGLKSCLFDSESKQIISNLIPFSLLQDKDFFYFDYITNKNRIHVDGMICFVIIRPSSLKALIEELSSPFYSSYVVFFTTAIDPFALEIIANADSMGVVSGVYELNVDVLKQSTKLYTICSTDNKRITDGLTSSLLSLGIVPDIKSTSIELTKDLKFDFPNFLEKNGTLMILDRNFDLITPLMYDWHYISLIYEHVEINNQIIKINKKEFSLRDSFFNENKLLEISKVGINIENLIKEKDLFEKKINSQNFEEIKKALDLKNKLETHLSIYTHLMDICVKNNEFSEYQNEILRNKDSFDINKVSNFDEKLRFNIVLLYFLKYVKDWDAEINNYVEYKERLIRFQKKYKRISYPYKNSINYDLDIKLSYESPLRKIIKHLVLNKIKRNAFEADCSNSGDVSPLIIFINGGITMKEYREAMKCEEEYQINIVLLSTQIINTLSYTNELD